MFFFIYMTSTIIFDPGNEKKMEINPENSFKANPQNLELFVFSYLKSVNIYFTAGEKISLLDQGYGVMDDSNEVITAVSV